MLVEIEVQNNHKIQVFKVHKMSPRYGDFSQDTSNYLKIEVIPILSIAWSSINLKPDIHRLTPEISMSVDFQLEIRRLS